MPIYEFRCKKCESRFEALRPMGDEGKTLKCPECGAKAPEKLISSFATSATCGPSGGAGFG